MTKICYGFPPVPTTWDLVWLIMICPMTVQLLYFAGLREAFGGGETLHLPPGDVTVADILALLRARGGNWRRQLASGKALAFAVNCTIAAPETIVPRDAEVAIFPPVTGG